MSCTGLILEDIQQSEIDYLNIIFISSSISDLKLYILGIQNWVVFHTAVIK